MTQLSPLSSHDGTTPADISQSVAILAPRGRDSSVASQVLEQDQITSIPVPDMAALAGLIERQIGAVLIVEEMLGTKESDHLGKALSAQPTWSDVPFIILAKGPALDRTDRAIDRIDTLNNAVLLSRPLHAEELVRAVRSALKARLRQYDARKHLEELQDRERRLYESEAKFHAIANSVEQMIWSALPDGFHDYYNDRWYEFTGAPEGSTDGEGWNGMFHPDDQAQAWERWNHCLQTGAHYEIEYRLRHNSGAYRWVLGRAQPVRAKDGTIVRWYGTCTDIHERKVAEEQRQLMLGEMNHRVKNTLAMVNVMVSQTLRQSSNMAEAQTAIQSRIGMMAQAHDRLINAAWAETRLTDVVDTALAPHRTHKGQFKIDGPDLAIGSKQALALTMALHELSTNAFKYGALSSDSGMVDIRWNGGPDDDTFVFRWTEQDGPSVAAPTRRGFGSRMIEQALMSYFQGSAELTFDPAGLQFSLKAPMSGLL